MHLFFHLRFVAAARALNCYGITFRFCEGVCMPFTVCNEKGGEIETATPTPTSDRECIKWPKNRALHAWFRHTRGHKSNDGEDTKIRFWGFYRPENPQYQYNEMEDFCVRQGMRMWFDHESYDTNRRIYRPSGPHASSLGG